MKKILKMLFSRFIIIILAIILQLCLYIFFPLFLSASFPFVPVNLILSLLAIVLVISIINSRIIIEGQMPLIILCIISPIVGIAFCTIFLNVKMPKKVKKYANNTFNQIKNNLTLSDEQSLKLQEELGDVFGQFNYIYQTTLMPAYKNTHTTFFRLGEEFFEALLTELKRAEKYIFMEYFIIENGKMWNEIHEVLKEKVSYGVEVRVMYDDLGTIAKLPSNFAKKLKKEGIKCVKFNEYSSQTSALYNNRDHRKITVIDGKVGFIGGVNIADEYINETHPFGHWKDSAVKLEGDAVKNLLCMFLQQYDIQTKQTENFEDYFSNFQVEANGVVCPFGDGPKYVYGENIANNVYINMISQAKKYVYITTPYLIMDSKLKNALISASLRGVDVRIITPHIPDKKSIFLITRSSYIELMEKGVKIFEYTEGFIHSKQVLVDDELAVVGTINFDYRSLLHHYECGVLMYKTDCIADIKLDFEKILTTATSMQGYKQKFLTKIFCALAKLFTPLF